MSLSQTQRDALDSLAQDVRDHVDEIEQDVPDESFVVGGAVRDTIMGLSPNDMDFVVVGESVESMLERDFRRIEASSFPVFHDSERQEWALARTESSTGSDYTDFDVETDDVGLEADLKRRDLCLNAIALDPFAGDGDWKLIDPHDGVQDIEQGVLRHVSDAFESDPLRILRVARYAARFAVPPNEEAIEFDESDGGFTVSSETQDMMRRLAPDLNRLTRDRIGNEIVDAMDQARRPSRFWEVLRDCGALAVIWPELDRANCIPAGPKQHHYESADMFDE